MEGPLLEEKTSDESAVSEPTNSEHANPGQVVLKIPELLTKILEFTIYEHTTVSAEAIRATREVSWGWLRTVSGILMKNGTAMKIGFEPREDHVNIDKASRKKLVNFLNCFGRKKELDHIQAGSVIPVKLNFPCAVFVRRNYEILLALFTKCQRLIIELNVELPREDFSMQRIRKQLHLPPLRKLTISFRNGRKALDLAHLQGWDKVETTYKYCSSGLYFLQAIMSGSQQLYCLEILSTEDCTFPANLATLTLPKTLETVNFKGILGTEVVGLFGLNSLSALTALTFKLGSIAMGDNISQIIQLTRVHLKYLEIDGDQFDGILGDPAVIFLPVCPFLVTIRILTPAVMLGNDKYTLRNICPSLDVLHLSCQVVPYMEKWFQAEKSFSSVATLAVSIIQPYYYQGHPDFSVSISSFLLEKMHLSCPGVKNIALCLTFNDLTAFEYIFCFMSNLNSLRLDFVGEIPAEGREILESKILGIPQCLVRCLRDHDEFLEYVQLANTWPNVKCLTELQSLLLITPDEYDDGEISLVSKLMVGQGFDKIPKLRRLGLHGRFKVTREQMAVWSKCFK